MPKIKHCTFPLLKKHYFLKCFRLVKVPVARKRNGPFYFTVKLYDMKKFIEPEPHHYAQGTSVCFKTIITALGEKSRIVWP
jgi:hypothetical protein